MALRDTMRSNAQKFLEPGESIQAVFGAQTASQWWVLLSVFILLFLNSYRVVVVTDRRIIVCRSGRVRMSPVVEVLRAGSRQTRIGPPKGLWYKTGALGEELYIHKRFHKDIEAADAALA